MSPIDLRFHLSYFSNISLYTLKYAHTRVQLTDTHIRIYTYIVYPSHTYCGLFLCMYEDFNNSLVFVYLFLFVYSRYLERVYQCVLYVKFFVLVWTSSEIQCCYTFWTFKNKHTTYLIRVILLTTLCFTLLNNRFVSPFLGNMFCSNIVCIVLRLRIIFLKSLLCVSDILIIETCNARVSKILL